MIEGFDIETAPLNEFEKKLVPVIIKELYDRNTPNKAIFGNLICKKISDKYQTTFSESRLRKITNYLRASKILPVMATNRGYYISEDKIEIQKQIDSLQGRKNAIEQAICGLKQWL